MTGAIPDEAVRLLPLRLPGRDGERQASISPLRNIIAGCGKRDVADLLATSGKRWQPAYGGVAASTAANRTRSAASHAWLRRSVVSFLACLFQAPRQSSMASPAGGRSPAAWTRSRNSLGGSVVKSWTVQP